MLGWFRFLLALMVAVAHLTLGVSYFSAWGIFAVFGFYLISGYLITAVLHETYKFRFVAFTLNRFLRLFPMYYLVVAVTLPIILYTSTPTMFHPAWTLSNRPIDVLGQLLIVPFAFYDAPFRLVPPTWSVAVELVNYGLLWLVVGRTRWTAGLAIVAAAVYHVATLVQAQPWMTRYTPFYAALLPFAIGSWLYLDRERLGRLSPSAATRLRAAAIAGWIANLLLCSAEGGLASARFNLYFYLNLACLTALVITLSSPASRALWARSGKIVGDLAYPIFLSHFLIGYVAGICVLHLKGMGLPLLAVTIVPLLAFAFVLTWLGDRAIEPLRNRVRGHGVERPPAQPLDSETTPAPTLMSSIEGTSLASDLGRPAL